MANFIKNTIVLFLCLYFTHIAEARLCPPSKCPKYGLALVAVLEDKEKYVTCINGNGFINHCPEGEYFSYDDKACGPNDVPGPIVCEYIEEPFESANNISERCLSNTVTPFTCPDVLPEDSLFPHPDDTHLFYYCVEPGQPPICRECPDDLHFNVDKRVCDFKSTNNENLHQLIGPTSAPPSNSTGSEICETTSGPYADLRPDVAHCNRYHVCDWGRLITMYCPEGLHFNPVLKVCDAPDKARCAIFA